MDGSSGTQHVLKLKKAGKISLGGIPNSRNILFLQIFLKRAAKPSAGNPVEPVEIDHWRPDVMRRESYYVMICM